jgi:hypothetical protein
VNLESLDFDELQLLLAGMELHPRRYALQLFPHRPLHYVRAAKLMALYAAELLEARRYRAQGHIADALKVEERCEAIYRQLPEYARW